MRAFSLLGLSLVMGCPMLGLGPPSGQNSSGYGGGGYGGGGGYNQNIVGEYEPWGSAGQPAYGDYPDPAQLASAFTEGSSWKQACADLRISPRDPRAPKAGQSFVANTQLVDIYLDRDGTPEKAIIAQTHSGEYFMVVLAQAADERSWVHLGTYALPALAHDPKCRAQGDGIYRAQGANMVKSAPQFLWIEFQQSDICAEPSYTERSLRLYALVEGSFGPIFEETLVREQRSKKAGQLVGEQINYTIQLDEKKGGLLLDGPRETYDGSGGQPQITQSKVWYDFNGRAYQLRQNAKSY